MYSERDFKYGGGGYGVGYGYGYDPLKGLLVPLAGVALLGAAALFVSNPVLLQLGVIGGKRRRREAVDDPMASYEKLKEIQALETFIEQLPPAQVARQEKKLVANYLKCSSSLGGSKCLERLACEIQKPSSNSTAIERQVLDIVTGEMMKNEYVPKDLKHRIKKAEELGAEGGKCERYFCSEVDLV
uniref:ATP synthase subunit b 1 n=1 Tax=Lygus hesperus TaxID=30085 RepID=A0A0A9X438_LYGHE